MSQIYIGYGLVLASALTWAASSIVVKHTYSYGLGAIPVLIIQTFIAALLAWSWVLVRRNSTSVPPSLRFRLVCQGTVGGFFASVFFYTTLDHLGASLATLLYFTSPAVIALYNSLIRHIPASSVERWALGMALVGILCSVDIFDAKAGQIAFPYVATGLAAALSNAFISINGEVLLKDLDTPVVTAYSFTCSMFILIVAFRPWWLLATPLPGLQAGFISLGAILTVLPVMLYLAGLKRVGSGVASIVSVGEIPLTLLLAWLFLGERMNFVQLSGAILITTSVGILYSSQAGSH